MWITARIYYYAEEKEQFLLSCIRPLLASLQEAGLCDRAYFLRRWQRGPHICLYLNTTASRSSVEELQGTIKREVDAYLKLHPSTRILTEDDLRANHERLARLEKVSGPLFPLLPDNSIHFGGDDHREQTYGGYAGMRLTRFFLAESTPIVLNLFQQMSEGKVALLPQTLRLMLITSSSLGPLSTSYISFRSHVEGFLNGFDASGRLRKQFDQRYQKQAKMLQRQIHPYLIQARYTENELDRSWQHLLDRFVPMLKEAIASGQIQLSMPQGRNTRLSAFHQESYKNPWILSFMHTPEFAVRRFLLNLLYEMMLQSGIKPLEKCALCYMVSCAIEEATGTSWQELQALAARNMVPSGKQIQSIPEREETLYAS